MVFSDSISAAVSANNPIPVPWTQGGISLEMWSVHIFLWCSHIKWKYHCNLDYMSPGA